MTSAQFVGVGSDSIPLDSFKPTGDDVSDSVMIQTLDFAGRDVNSYYWINWAGENSDQEAWVDDNFEIVSDVSFAPGQGLWIQGSSTEQGMQTAGQVQKSDVSVTLCAGFTATGNPYPVAVNLQDVIPEGADVSDSVMIQTLDFAGRDVNSYYWINWAGENSDQEAWVDDNFEIVSDVSFAPGQGLWVQGANTEQTLRFPAPEL